MRYKAVLFDGYGTLFEGAMEKLIEICAEIVRDYSIALSPEDFLKAWDHYFFPLIRNEDSFVTLRQAHIETLPIVFRDLNLGKPSLHYVNDLFEWFSQASLFDDVTSTLRQLDGHISAIVSNADIDHLEAALSLNNLSFSTVISSESAKSYKPAKRIFHIALKEIGCSPEETLYVGDSQDDDIVGTRRAGLNIAWLNRTGETLKAEIPKPKYEINSLEEILEII